MDLTQTLVSYTHSAFDRSPESFIAFRARHASDAYRYTVRDRVLTGYLGDAQLFAANLAEHTLDSLVRFISAQPGMSVVYAAPPDELRNSAMSLLDGSGAQVSSNGDCVYAYGSLLWALMHAYAIELAGAEDAIADMLDQMSIATADNEFLDEWSGYFGFPRAAGELDAALRLRVLQEALRPRSNNMAISCAIEERFGNAANVIDITTWGDSFPVHGANDLLAIEHDGQYFHDAAPQQILGFFDVEVEPQLERSAFDEYLILLSVATALLGQATPGADGEIEQQRQIAAQVDALRTAADGLALESGIDEAAFREFAESLRAAGTQLRRLSFMAAGS